MRNIDIIAEYLKTMQDVKKDYDFAVMSVNIEDKTTQDLLHGIEFSTDKKERNRLATQLKRSRNDRREYKNRVEALEPLVKYMNTYGPAIEQLKQVLGKIRKIENDQANRTYYPRVLKGENDGRQSIAAPEQAGGLPSLSSEIGMDFGISEGHVRSSKGKKAR